MPEEKPEPPEFRPPTNIKVKTEQPLAQQEEITGVLRTIVEATKEVISGFEHSVKNEYEVTRGKWEVKKTPQQFLQTNPETGQEEIVETEVPLVPMMNDLGLFHYKALFLNASLNIATSQYEKKEAMTDMFELEDVIADDLLINQIKFEIASGDMPMLESIIRSNLKACINKAINAKLLDKASSQITHSEIAQSDRQSKGFWDKARQFLGG